MVIYSHISLCNLVIGDILYIYAVVKRWSVTHYFRHMGIIAKKRDKSRVW